MGTLKDSAEKHTCVALLALLGSFSSPRVPALGVLSVVHMTAVLHSCVPELIAVRVQRGAHCMWAAMHSCTACVSLSWI